MSLPSGPKNAGSPKPGYQRPAWIAGAVALLVLVALAAFWIGKSSGSNSSSAASPAAETTTDTSGDGRSSTNPTTTSSRTPTTTRASDTRQTTTTSRRSSTSSSRQTTTSDRRTTTTQAQREFDRESGLRIVGLSRLPDEAADTYALIESDGPFPFDRDGVVFQNRERLLPRQASGWYREYTVITPGSDDRGARRLIVGKDDTVYYTQDHYDSFVVVDVDR